MFWGRCFYLWKGQCALKLTYSVSHVNYAQKSKNKINKFTIMFFFFKWNSLHLANPKEVTSPFLTSYYSPVIGGLL